MQITSGEAELLFYIVIISIMILSYLYSQYRRKHRGINVSGSSVLLTYYTESVDLLPIKQGKIGTLHYSAIATTDAKMLIYRIELPFSSKIHLLSIPKSDGIAQLQPANSNSLLEKVSLEGDYDSYFSLYAEKNQQADARYILDPTAMLLTVKFCKSHNWELINNELYFLQANKNEASDPTDMFDDILPFIQEIRPAVSRPLTDLEIRNTTPYGLDRRTNLKCPVCRAVMQNKESYYLCPDQHGVLLTGRMLANLRSKENIITIKMPDIPKNTEEILVCPSCGNELTKIQYNGESHIIDSCSNCPYRWLDAAEVIDFQNTEKQDFDITTYI